MGVRNRLRSLFRLFLLFTVLVAVALLSAITTIRLTIHGRQENMPKLVGISLESAQRITAGLGLELKVEDKIYSTQYAANAIAQQMPPPGTPLKMGQHVHVLVSLGLPQLTVPNLVGDSVRAARITAIQRGLTVGDVAVLPWPGDPDQVVAQDPPPATAEVRTPTVNLLISGGEEPPAYLCPRFYRAAPRRGSPRSGEERVQGRASNPGGHQRRLPRNHPHAIPSFRKQNRIGRGLQFPGHAVRATAKWIPHHWGQIFVIDQPSQDVDLP